MATRRREGYGRYNFMDNRKFVGIARSSCFDVLDHMITAHDEGMILDELLAEGRSLAQEAIRLLNGYMAYLKRADQSPASDQQPTTNNQEPRTKNQAPCSMLQLLQHLGDGRTILAEVPAPGPRRGALLIRTTRSLISAGTERMLVDFGKAGWIGKARQQPEKVRAVLNKVLANGIFETVRAVRAKLGQPIALGYCQVGEVVAVCDDSSQLSVEGSPERTDCHEPRTKNQELLTDAFCVGDRVVSNGPHAEVVSIQHDLCAKVPPTVSDEAASFTPLCAIALQGINLLAPAPGDKVVVTGLGLIGQLAVRILRASGCEVLGLDPSAERRALAERSGAKTAQGDPVRAALAWSNGKGVVGVLITASTSSNEVVNQAARSCRHRGKVVLIGVVGLQLNRADFYRNEVSFQVSCSYGARSAGAPSSAQGNFSQVLAWMAQGKLLVEDLITHRFEFAAAPDAYAQLADRSALGIVLTYSGGKDDAPLFPSGNPGLVLKPASSGAVSGKDDPPTPGFGAASGGRRANDVLNRTIELRAKRQEQGARLRVALIGAGNFATRTLLPAMTGLSSPPEIAVVASAQGASALLAAQSFGAERATTDVTAVLADPSMEAVFITTWHDAHAAQTVDALRAGKHVWVEKPLCLNLDELRQIEAVLSSQISVTGSEITNNQEPITKNRAPTLMVGFNRRFSPMAVALRQALVARPGPHRLVMTVNAGRLEPDHWTLDPQKGGGRIVGEACHFLDLSRYLIGAPIKDVRCVRRDTDGQDGGAFEVSFEGGASCLIDYRTDLAPHLPKEIIEVYGDTYFAQIRNWSQLTSRGLRGLRQGGFWSRAPRKGHPEAIEAFLKAVQGAPVPIPLDEILEVSRWCIAMQAMSAEEARSEAR